MRWRLRRRCQCRHEALRRLLREPPRAAGTDKSFAPSNRVNHAPSCWLIVNPSSGSNDESSTTTLVEALTQRGWNVARTVIFPEQPLPDPRTLDQAGIELVVIYTGDGSINALVAALAGWGGAVLVLPGGTMNLLAQRLHRTVELGQILDIVTGGGAQRRRPLCVRCEAGLGLAGLLVGPGTCWGKVRESMRNLEWSEAALKTIEAIRHTATSAPVIAEGSTLARDGGYPLIELTPGEHGIQITGYFAEDPIDYAEQAWATLRRRFREGPHDRLGIGTEFVLASIDQSPLACLIDGEPAELPSSSRFWVEECPVDLLASGHDF